MKRWQWGVLSTVLLTALVVPVVRWSVLRHTEETLRRAGLHLAGNRVELAAEEAKWVTLFSPEDPRVLQFRGQLLIAEDRLDEAVQVWSGISPGSTPYAEVAGPLAQMLLEAGRWTKAERVLEQLCQQLPDSFEARAQLMRLYLAELRKRDAVLLLRSRLAAAPDDLTVLPHLLDLETKTIPPHERLAPLERASRLQANQVSVIVGLARTLARTGNPAKAQAWFDQAIRAGVNSDLTRLAAAEFYLDSGLPKQSDPLLRAAAPSEGLYAAWHYLLLARRDAALGRVQAAIESVERSLRCDPAQEAALLLKADLLRQRGKTDASATVARKAAAVSSARQRLMVLSETMDRANPSPEHCDEIATLLKVLHLHDQAAAWQRVGQLEAAAMPFYN